MTVTAYTTAQRSPLVLVPAAAGSEGRSCAPGTAACFTASWARKRGARCSNPALCFGWCGVRLGAQSEHEMEVLGLPKGPRAKMLAEAKVRTRGRLF